MKEFLESLKDLYEIVIFTASQQPYADALLDILDPKGVLFHHRLFRTSCTFTQGYYVKNLARLGRPIDQTVIVDNSPQSFMLHVENGIPITSWFGDLDDRELLKLRTFLQEMHCQSVKDVRDFLRKKFEWIS
jgi:Dullard-like phosphatase family protein